jgi:hypothetical protein
MLNGFGMTLSRQNSEGCLSDPPGHSMEDDKTTAGQRPHVAGFSERIVGVLGEVRAVEDVFAPFHDPPIFESDEAQGPSGLAPRPLGRKA